MQKLLPPLLLQSFTKKHFQTRKQKDPQVIHFQAISDSNQTTQNQ
jgi:hypothetical protein